MDLERKLFKVDIDSYGERGVLFDIKKSLGNSFRAANISGSVRIVERSLQVEAYINENRLVGLIDNYKKSRKKDLISSYTIQEIYKK